MKRDCWYSNFYLAECGSCCWFGLKKTSMCLSWENKFNQILTNRWNEQSVDSDVWIKNGTCSKIIETFNIARQYTVGWLHRCLKLNHHVMTAIIWNSTTTRGNKNRRREKKGLDVYHSFYSFVKIFLFIRHVNFLTRDFWLTFWRTFGNGIFAVLCSQCLL